jgi:hypothetical protein
MVGRVPLPASARGKLSRAPHRAGKRLQLSTGNSVEPPLAVRCAHDTRCRTRVAQTSRAQLSSARRASQHAPALKCARSFRSRRTWTPAGVSLGRLDPEAAPKYLIDGRRTRRRRPFKTFVSPAGRASNNPTRPARLTRRESKLSRGRDPASIAECGSKREKIQARGVDPGRDLAVRSRDLSDCPTVRARRSRRAPRD